MSVLISDVSGKSLALRFALELDKTHSFTSPTCEEPLLADDALD